MDILTKMQEESQNFAIALRKTQELGYAEANSALDVKAFDALYKTAILDRSAFNIAIISEQIYRKERTKIIALDFLAASKLGYTIKFLAMGQKIAQNKFDLRCHPLLLNKTNPLAYIKDVFNACCLSGDFVGELMLYDRGAGSLPTASAIVSDLIRCIREEKNKHLETPLSLNFYIQPIEELKTNYYLRFKSK